MNKIEKSHRGIWSSARVPGLILPVLFCLLSFPVFQASADQPDHHGRGFLASVDDGHRDDYRKRDAGSRGKHEAEDERKHARRGEDSGKADEDVLPLASISDVSINEGDAGTKYMAFTVNLSGLADGHATLHFSTENGTSRAGADYLARRGRLFIPAGSTTANIRVSVMGDTVYEPDETLNVILSSPSANLTLGKALATGTIINDDTSRQNDTGILSRSGAGGIYAAAASFPPGQDADVGRDANPATNNDADGRAGFSFTKLDSAGIPLHNQTAAYDVTPWDCVQDNVTGLMWEVKAPAGSGGLRDSTYEYTWYNSDATSNGGYPGRENGGICADAVNCDTEKYAAAVNAVRLCSYNDWRMPKKEELNSIKDYGISLTGFAIDMNYFPNTFQAWYWSATPSYLPNLVWGVGFSYLDNSGLGIKSWMDHVRLVRGKP